MVDNYNSFSHPLHFMGVLKETRTWGKRRVYLDVKTCDIFSLFRWLALAFGYCLMISCLICFLCFKSSVSLTSWAETHCTNISTTQASKQKKTLTTASLSGVWVPQTSGSLHYWLPAPRWECSHGWQLLASQPWAPMPKGRRAPMTLT